jgi:hypothetical protein
MTFAGIALLALLVIATGLANRIPGDDQPPDPTAATAYDGKTGPPPVWVVILMVVVLVVTMLVLAWYWPE